jgi:hypothetical protein
MIIMINPYFLKRLKEEAIGAVYDPQYENIEICSN